MTDFCLPFSPPSPPLLSRRYDRLLPYLNEMPLHANVDAADEDWSPLPHGRDASLVRTVTVALRQSLRAAGMPKTNVDALELFVLTQLARMAAADAREVAPRSVGQRLPEQIALMLTTAASELSSEAARVGRNTFAGIAANGEGGTTGSTGGGGSKAAGGGRISRQPHVGAQASHGGPWPELAESHLNDISEVVRSLKEAAAAGTFQCVAGGDSPSTNKGDASMVPSPVVASATDTYPWSACYPLFGRLRRDTSVEHLAGKCQESAE